MKILKPFLTFPFTLDYFNNKCNKYNKYRDCKKDRTTRKISLKYWMLKDFYTHT